jgi:hypothetical protein
MTNAVSADVDSVVDCASTVIDYAGTVSDYASENGAAASTVDCRRARKLRLVVPGLRKRSAGAGVIIEKGGWGTSLAEAPIVKA